MEITIESYIDFCSSMDVATESFSSIKAALISGFSKLILWIESKVKKMKDSKVKSTFMKLLSRAKQGLSKSKSLKEHNPEMVKKLQEEMNDIKEETKNVDNFGYKFYQPNETHDKLIANKEYGTIKGVLVSMIGGDPTWATTEFDEFLDYLNKNGISLNDLTEKFELQENEDLNPPKEKWTKKLFGLYLVYLRDNFNLDKRLPLIKEMGKEVYKNEKTYGWARANNHK